MDADDGQHGVLRMVMFGDVDPWRGYSVDPIGPQQPADHSFRHQDRNAARLRADMQIKDMQSASRGCPKDMICFNEVYY
jgi:hypothetical protein